MEINTNTATNNKKKYNIKMYYQNSLISIVKDHHWCMEDLSLSCRTSAVREDGVLEVRA